MAKDAVEKAPLHCGQEMKYAGFRMATESVHTLKTEMTFKCQAPGCKQEEIITTTRSDYNPDWLKDLAGIMERQWEHVYRRSKELEPAWEHLRQRNLEIEQLCEKLKNDIAEAERERAKPFWQRVLALIRLPHEKAAEA